MRAWTIRKGTKAPQAAGVIHTDFEKNFVCGEIMRYEDLKELGSEAAVKAAGKYSTKGKEYEVQVFSLLRIMNLMCRMGIYVIGSQGRNELNSDIDTDDFSLSHVSMPSLVPFFDREHLER